MVFHRASVADIGIRYNISYWPLPYKGLFLESATFFEPLAMDVQLSGTFGNNIREVWHEQ